MHSSTPFLAALATLTGSETADERRQIWRQGLAALVAAAEREPAPLEGLPPEQLLAALRLAMRDQLLDLDWMSPAAAATAIFALAQALPSSHERRELGRQVLAGLHGGDHETFVTIATALALSSPRALDGAAVRARIEVAISAPLAGPPLVGALALALLARPDLAERWLHQPATGSLPDRRLSARLLAHASRAAVNRAAVGDLDGVQMLSSALVRASLQRLLADREALVWRFAAIARGLLAHELPEFAVTIDVELMPGAASNHHRRAATSAAAALERHGLASRWREPLRARATDTPGVATATIMGLAGLAATDPAAADSLAAQMLGHGGIDALEALQLVAREEGNLSLPHTRDTAKALIDKALRDDDAQDDGRVVILQILRAELSGNPSTEPLAMAGANVRAAIDAGNSGEAIVLARNAIEELATITEQLERAADDDALDRRHSMRLWREVDRTFLSDDTVAGALALAKGGELTATLLEELLGRLEAALLAREGTAELRRTVPHYSLRLVRLRALVRLLDRHSFGVDDVGRRARRLASTRSLMLRARAERSPLRRAVWAAMTRAWDSLLRNDDVEISDLLLVLPNAFDSDEDFTIMREASMEPDVERLLDCYTALTAAGWAATDPSDDDAVKHALCALDNLVAALPRGRSVRVESTRVRTADLARTLRSLARIPSRAAIDVTLVDDLAERISVLANRMIGAHTRVGISRPPQESPADAFHLLARAIERGNRTQGGRFDTEISNAIDAARGSLPTAIATVVGLSLTRLVLLPDVAVELPPLAVARETSLPSWLPLSRTLGGFYIERALSSGAGGSVFIACRTEHRDNPDAERVALKVPDYDGGAARALSQQEFENMFRDEAGALLAIPTHENLAAFVTFDARTKPKPVLVMELVAGPTLERALELGVFDLPRVLAIIDGIGAGLTAMHHVGVAHLDLKPANVILRDGSGPPVLVDFGLAGRKLRPGCGSACYGSPEVWSGAWPGADARATDVYAYACIAFELLTGECLVDEETLQKVFELHLQGGASRRVQLGMSRAPALANLAQLLMPSLSVDPTKRPTAARLRAGFAAIAPDFLGRSWPLTG